jgi:hypothetical protein
MSVWYISHPFCCPFVIFSGYFFVPVLVCCSKKNLATLLTSMMVLRARMELVGCAVSQIFVANAIFEF